VAEVRELVAVGDEAEPLDRVVQDPAVVVRQLGQVVAELVERRLRVADVPDEDARDQKGPRAS
jgi:hypothetical protein